MASRIGPAVLCGILLSAIAVSTANATLLHVWHADGDAEDAVGDDDGELSGGITFADGLSGQGFAFDGEDDLVEFGATTGNFGTSDFTIAFVIRTTSAGANEGVLAKRAICNFSSFWDVRSSSTGHLSLEVYDGNFNSGVGTSVSINDGLFHTVVFTRSGGIVRAYVDGFLRGEHDSGSTANLSNEALLVAGSGACVGMDGTVPFTGLLDEIRLADHADPGLLPAFFHCGDVNMNAEISASDALSALRTAVGSQPCLLCLCDANGNGTVTAPDALAILRRGVGSLVPLLCELCTVDLD